MEISFSKAQSQRILVLIGSQDGHYLIRMTPLEKETIRRKDHYNPWKNGIMRCEKS
jgi:hypothetical protein